jgi:ectoine hydroxylase-related dioxygenase (phytanoyl-CoA dioxygenase family)
MNNTEDDHDEQVVACGPAGSMIIFNASVWHSHGANRSGQATAFDTSSLCSHEKLRHRLTITRVACVRRLCNVSVIWRSMF